MGNLTILVLMSLLVESIVDGVKGAFAHWAWVSLVLGAALCPLAGIDAFEMLGMPLRVPLLGAMLTGTLVGRGASVIYDLAGRLGDITSRGA